jgi:hypothetical protein
MSAPSIKDLFDLERPLEQISEHKFREIAKLLEEIHDQPEVQQIMDRMRPRLTRVRPVRKPNLQRLFYLPSEDLLVNQLSEKEDGRIPRKALALAWNYVVTKSDPAERKIIKIMEERLKAMPAGDTQGQAVMARRIWPSAAALLEDAVVAAGTKKAIRQELVGDEVELLDSIRQIVRMLHVAEDIQLLKDTLPPKPIRGLAPSQLALVRQTVALSHQGKLDRAYAVMLAVLVRMSSPAELLQRSAHLNFDLPDTTKANLFAKLGRTVLADMEKRAADIGSQAEEDFPRRTDKTHFLINELVAASRVLRDSDPTTRDRMARLQKTAEETVSAVVNAASDVVIATIQTGPAAPIDDLMRAEAGVIALRKCMVFADDVGLAPVIRRMLAKIVGDIRAKVANLFVRLNQQGSSALDKATVEREMYWSVRMLELAGDPDEAEQIRQTGVKLLAGV